MSSGSSSSSSQLSSVAGGLEHVAACASSVSARTNSTLVIRMELGPLPTVTSEARPAGDAADGWIMTERLTGRGSPGPVASHAITSREPTGRAAQPVRFAGIDDELGRAAEASQRLVELLAVLDRNVPIDVASHDEGGSHDPLHLVERGQPLPHRPGPPREAQLLLPLVLIVVVAVVRDVEDLAGAADRSREAVG